MLQVSSLEKEGELLVFFFKAVFVILLFCLFWSFLPLWLSFLFACVSLFVGKGGFEVE